MKQTPLLIVLLTALSVLGGCGGKKTRPDADGTYGPVPPPGGAPASTEAPQPEQGPVGPEEPVGPLPDPDFVPPDEGYVLVLGPGLARGLAYIGVLHELEARHVNIRAIVGVEMGALVAGIWASSNLNNLEWEMHKFNRRTLLDVPMLSIGDKVAEGKRLLAFLDRALKVDFLQKMKTPVVVASAHEGENEIIYETSGSAKEIIRGAMSIPGIIKPFVWDGISRVTAALETPFPAEKAKELGLGKTLCVDVINHGDNFDYNAKGSEEIQMATLMRSVGSLARSQLKDCDSVLRIPTDGIGYFDFKSKAELTYRGKLAVRKWLEAQQ